MWATQNPKEEIAESNCSKRKIPSIAICVCDSVRHVTPNQSTSRKKAA